VLSGAIVTERVFHSFVFVQDMAVPNHLLGDSQQQGGPRGRGAGSSADVTNASNASGGARQSRPRNARMSGQELSQRSNDSYFCARLTNLVRCICAFIFIYFLASLFISDPVPLTAAQAFACRIGVCPVQLYKPRYEVVWESMKIALSMLVMYV
jgi:hypothetical protein